MPPVKKKTNASAPPAESALTRLMTEILEAVVAVVSRLDVLLWRSKPEPTASCAHCLYYLPRTCKELPGEEETWEELGNCRRYPTVVRHFRHDWCGEYVPRAVAAPEASEVEPGELFSE